MIDRVISKRIVPVVVIDDAERAPNLAESLLVGGLDLIEITFRTSAAEAAIRAIAARFPEMIIGAGTLLNGEQVRRAKDAGASFGLAPGLNSSVVEAAKREGLDFSPGVITPSDVEKALELGCSLLKFFPAGLPGGLAMLKALSGPYGHTGVKFIPTGGITVDNMTEYLRLPSVAAVGGSWMVEQKLVADQNWTEISSRTRAALATALGKQDEAR